jgi:hypothetical protein
LDHEVAGVWRPLRVFGRTQHPRGQRRAVAQHPHVGGRLLARFPMAVISIFCLLPTSAYNSRFDTRARVAISRVLVAA